METTISIDGQRWRVRVDGDSESAPLLLLHGFTGCIEVWDDVVEKMGPRVRIIRVDLTGHGASDAPVNVSYYTMESVSRALAQLLDRLDVNRADVSGYSMGGRLALFFALEHPGRVNCLVLESASPGLTDPDERETRRRADAALADAIERDGVPSFIDSWLAQPLFADQQRLPEHKQTRGRDLRLRHSALGLANSLRGMGTGAQRPLHGRLHELACPVLILNGEHDAKFREIGKEMAASIDDATIRIVLDCGHAPHWESPESCTGIVTRFLSDHPAVDVQATTRTRPATVRQH